MEIEQYFDILVIGSGAAGLSLALQLPKNLKIGILSKSQLEDGSTFYAQGGIAAVLDPKDSLKAHIDDTINAGAGLCNPETVAFTVEHGPAAIEWLIQQNTPFTKEDLNSDASSFHLTREGGHSARRIIHAADATGRAVECTLVKSTKKQKNIHLLENHIAVDLITTEKLGLPEKRCVGAYVLDRKHDTVKTIHARFTVLATGGASKTYLYTSNPDGSSGDGIAMAWRAGCRIANMEFNQFHPTCLFHPKAGSFLITEAIRGEGGKLLLSNGERFMHRFDEREELAPRDIVARAIDYEMKRLGDHCVYLDISHKPAKFIREHFPTIYAKCLEFGFDMTKEALPVVPAAHYTCGGVMTDLNAKTDLDCLYAIGETSYTGLHGANRMASNSLLECFVFAKAASEHIQTQIDKIEKLSNIPIWDASRVSDSDEQVVVSHNWHELRQFMWDYVGIVRTSKRLQRAKRRVDLLSLEINEYYGNFHISSDLLELRNLVQVADLIIQSAQARKESRGLHYTLDYLEMNEDQPPQNTILTPENY